MAKYCSTCRLRPLSSDHGIGGSLVTGGDFGRLSASQVQRLKQRPTCEPWLGGGNATTTPGVEKVRAVVVIAMHVPSAASQ